MAEVHVRYPGAFVLTFGRHRFEVYIGDNLVKAASGYRKAWSAVVAVPLGSHRLEIRTIDRIEGWRRSRFFNFSINQEAAHRMGLRISHAWGRWKQPLLKCYDAHVDAHVDAD